MNKPSLSKPRLVGMAMLLFGFGLPAKAQESMPGRPVVCYGSSVTHQSRSLSVVGPTLRLGQQTATIDVTYTNFPAEAMPPFQQAVNTWTTLISSPVPIHIHATWASLSGNAIASTTATKIYRGFAGATQSDVWYPVALAEKLTGHDLNGTGLADITITINKDNNWYVGTDGNTPANRTDLESVVLHEIAHGLGFTSAAHTQDNTGSLRDDGHLLIYDRLLETKSGTRTSTYPDPSSALLTQLTTDNLYLHSPTAATNQNGFPKVYAPSVFNPGGSISHLDETAYPPGDPNSLMTPYIASGESMHSPGAILLGILADLGWKNSDPLVTEPFIFPNPGTGLVTIQVSAGSTLATLQVIDLTGRVVKPTDTLPINGLVTQTDLSGLANGLYILVITTSSGQFRRKLIVAK